ncbi:zinc finger protein SHOOT GRAVITROPISM 5-like [Impatiens glandulifera]|uniref:zinc finger protein SHOOT GRAVITROPISM 5-like n=1 Tax=Impatiens glandulifera TaxID=253017 RepID=UPI001FB0B9B5|nr:zinc finger protein SHOOT GRAVITROPISM 5-like [Impatiens glandulifera]
MLDTTTTGPSSETTNDLLSNKRKRRPAGTPDPDAEVVSLSPKTLLESDRYVCEICNQGFQRDQNLQMHRRRHKVPWKLLKRESPIGETKKRVYVCPEPTCLHHDPCHALGDLVGIKKHYRRKHSNNKQWVCDKCSKGYAVQSDYKAHIKTCGTRGHSCDCGRVFSRVESFIEHQDNCTVQRRARPEILHPACSSRTASSTSQSSDTNLNMASLQRLSLPSSTQPDSIFLRPNNTEQENRNLELQLLPSSSTDPDSNATTLKLSIGSFDNNVEQTTSDIEAARMKETASEMLKLAMAEKAYAEDARQQAKKQIELAEMEFANAKRIRQQAQAELEKAQYLKEQATKKISSALLEITCHTCKNQFQTTTNPSNLNGLIPGDETSLAVSYISSAMTEGEE